jgi:hypothetical protein
MIIPAQYNVKEYSWIESIGDIDDIKDRKK